MHRSVPCGEWLHGVGSAPRATWGAVPRGVG